MAMSYARQRLEETGRDAWTTCTRVMDGRETASFTKWFVDWDSNMA